MDKITARNEERLLRFLEPGIRSGHTRSRDILKPAGTTGIIISLDITQIGVGGLRMFYQFRDNQDNYLNVFQSIAINAATGTYQYLIHPQATGWQGLKEFFASPVPTVSAVQIRHTIQGSDFEYSVHGQFI